MGLTWLIINIKWTNSHLQPQQEDSGGHKRQWRISVGTQQGASKLPRSQSNQLFTGSHVSVDGTGLPFPRLTDPNKVTAHLHRSWSMSISPRFIMRVCFRKTNQNQVTFHSQLAFTWTSVNLCASRWEKVEQKGGYICFITFGMRDKRSRWGCFCRSCTLGVDRSARHLTVSKPSDPWCPLWDERKKHPHLLPCGRLCGEDPRKQSPRVHTSTWSSHFLRKLQSQRNLADGLWKRRRAPVVSVCPFEVVVSYRSWWFPQKCWLKRYSCIERGSPAIWSLISEAPSPAISDISQAMTNQG